MGYNIIGLVCSLKIRQYKIQMKLRKLKIKVKHTKLITSIQQTILQNYIYQLWKLRYTLSHFNSNPISNKLFFSYERIVNYQKLFYVHLCLPIKIVVSRKV